MRIGQPKSFSGEGETIEVSLLLRAWLESLTSWCKANRCKSFIREDGDAYERHYPMTVPDRRPDYDYLDETYKEVVTAEVHAVLYQAAVKEVKEVVDAGTGEVTTPYCAAVAEVKAVKYKAPVFKDRYVFDENERRKGKAKAMKELADYDHKFGMLKLAYEEKKIQLADTLFACIQSTTEGKAAKVVSGKIDEDPLTRCASVIHALEERFNIRSIRELPELEKRFSLCMPLNMDPEQFVNEKVRIRSMLQTLEGDGLVPMVIADAHLIVKILTWLPGAYSPTIDQIQNLILARGISDESTPREDDDSVSLSGSRSAAGSGLYSGENTVTLTLVIKLLREKYLDLVRRSAIKPATAEAARAYLTTGKVTKPKDHRACHYCGKKGHILTDCQLRKKDEAAKISSVHTVDDPIGAFFSPGFTGKCRLCEETGHGFNDCPIVVKGREALGKPKPPIKPLAGGKAGGGVGGVNFMIGDIVVCQASRVTRGPSYPPTYFMDDSGAASNIVPSADLLYGVRAINATCVGVGTARVTHVGSFLGKGLCVDGSEADIRLKTVYVVDGIDRNIFGTAAFQRQTSVTFDRSGPTPSCTAGGATFKLEEHGPDPFLWFQFRKLTTLTSDDDAWLEAAMVVNQAIGADDEESVTDTNGLLEEVLLLSSISDELVGEAHEIIDSPLYGIPQAPRNFASSPIMLDPSLVEDVDEEASNFASSPIVEDVFFNWNGQADFCLN